MCYYPDNVDDALSVDFVHFCVDCQSRALDRERAIERQRAHFGHLKHAGSHGHAPPPKKAKNSHESNHGALSINTAAIADEVEKDEPLDPKSLPEGDPDIEIESLIIPAVKDLHTKYLEEFERRQA